MDQDKIQLPRIGRHKFEEQTDSPIVFTKPRDREFFLWISVIDIIEKKFAKVTNPGLTSQPFDTPSMFGYSNNTALEILEGRNGGNVWIDGTDPDISVDAEAGGIYIYANGYEAVDRICDGFNAWISTVEADIENVRSIYNKYYFGRHV